MIELFSRNKEDMIREYKALAKKADQRLVRLEGYRHEKFFKTAELWSYKKALHDIQGRFGEDAKRFNRNVQDLNKNQIQAMINNVKNFLDSPTSTKKGILTIYQNRANVINERFGTTFTWQELAEYFTDGTAEKLEAKFGSATALKQIAKMQRKKDEIIEDIKKSAGKTTRVSQDQVNKAIYEKLAQSKLKISDLL